MKRKLLLAGLVLSFPMIFIACNDDGNAGPTTTKSWSLALDAKNENPVPVGRTETGIATLTLLSDNSLQYNITVNNLVSGDALVAAHLHAGTPIESGPIILGLDPTFNGGAASGIIKGIRQSLVDSLKSDANDIYLNVHSTQFGGGLVRAPLNATMDLAVVVGLNGANEVPPVVTNATGTAILRMTSQKNLYSNISVTGLEADDAFTAAHIHPAAAGVNGPVLVGLVNSVADFGTNKTIPLTDDQYNTIKGTNPIYVNAHSTKHPGGIIRGQIR